MLTEVKRFLGSEAWKISQWNTSETVLLAVLFVATVSIIPKAIKKIGIKFNKKFFQGTIAYAFLVAALAAIFSPFNGAILGAATIALSLLVSAKISKITELEELTFYRYFGLVTAAATLPLLEFNPALLSTAVFLPFLGSAVLLSRYINSAAVYAVAGQYFDAATSFAVLSSGGEELHILGGYFVELFGPQGIFAMKTAVVVPATLYIYRTSGERKRYYMFVIGFLGLALGLANLFRA